MGETLRAVMTNSNRFRAPKIYSIFFPNVQSNTIQEQTIEITNETWFLFQYPTINCISLGNEIVLPTLSPISNVLCSISLTSSTTAITIDNNAFNLSRGTVRQFDMIEYPLLNGDERVSVRVNNLANITFNIFVSIIGFEYRT